MSNISLFDQKQILKKYSNLSESSLSDISWSSDDGDATARQVHHSTTNEVAPLDDLLLDDEFLNEISSQYIQSIVKNHTTNLTSKHQDEDISFDFLKEEEEVEKNTSDRLDIENSKQNNEHVLQLSDEESLPMNWQDNLLLQHTNPLEIQSYSLSPLFSDTEVISREVLEESNDVFSFDEFQQKGNSNRGIHKSSKMKQNRSKMMLSKNEDLSVTTNTVIQQTNRKVIEPNKNFHTPYFVSVWNQNRTSSNNQLMNF